MPGRVNKLLTRDEAHDKVLVLQRGLHHLRTTRHRQQTTVDAHRHTQRNTTQVWAAAGSGAEARQAQHLYACLL